MNTTQHFEYTEEKVKEMLVSGQAAVLLGLTLLLLLLTVMSYNRLLRKVKQFLKDVDNWEL